MVHNSAVLAKHLNLSDEQIELLNKILSGLLPHENYDNHESDKLQNELFKTLLKEEVFGLYHMFYLIFENLNKIKVRYADTNTILTVNRDTFCSVLESYIPKCIYRPDFNAKLYFNQQGIEIDLNNPDDFHRAVDIVYSDALDLYDELFNLAIPTEDAFNYLMPLKESLKVSLMERCMNIEAMILKSSINISGRTFSGPEDCMYIRNLHQTEMNSRFVSEDDISERELDLTKAKNLEIYKSENPNKVIPLANLGYEPVDKLFPLRTQDIVSVIADEGVGKTRLVVDWAHTLLTAGKNILVVTGETDILKFNTMITLDHIFRKERKTITFDEYNDRTLIPHRTLDELEEINVLINGYEKDLLENKEYGKIILKQNVSYEKFYDYVKMKVIQDNIDVVIVDHVAVMKSDGSMTTDGLLNNNKKRIDWLYKMEDVLTKELNLCFINTVHTQTEASKAIMQGKVTGVRIAGESSATTKYSTLVVLLRTTPELKNQSIYILEFRKVRDYQAPPTLALCRNGATCSHWFDPRMQHFVTGEEDNITSTRINELIGIDEETEEENDSLGLGI